MKGRILVSVIMSTVLLLVPCAFSKQARPDPHALATFQKALERNGFVVTLGAAMVWDPVGAWCANQEIKDARWANTGSYLILQVPESVEVPTLTQYFKIRQDEAIVLIGLTPPPAKYFGFYAWVAKRFYPRGTDPQEGTKMVQKVIGATVGDAINNATIKTTGPTPYNSPVALIFTPDKGTDAGIRKALKSAGYPEEIVNTYVLPASMLNLGDSDYADELRIALRTAWFDDPDAGNLYIEDAPNTLGIFRVTPRTKAKASPLPEPPLRVRGTGKTEMRLMNKLRELRQGIINTYGWLYATDIVPPPTTYEDYDCLQREVLMDGGSRDALVLNAGWMPVWGSDDPITLADDEFLMVYGANHVATGKTTYMNINVYATAREVDGKLHDEGNVVVGSVYDDVFQGTAKGYLTGDPDAKLMYAIKVSRSCGQHEPNCLQLFSPCSRLTLDSSTVLGLFVRMYLEPATKVGPAMSEILYDGIIKFSPRPPKP